jgi:pimeloyl-ACP methyl ester carboxylesterase
MRRSATSRDSTDVPDTDRAVAFANIEKAARYYDVDLSETNWHQLGVHPQPNREESARKDARWDDAARAHALVGFSERARAVQAGFYTPGGFDPPVTRAGLGRVTAPVMMYAGQAEIGPTPELAAEAAGLFPGWELTVQPGAGHYPWLDDPAWFTARLLDFLG